MLLYAVFPCRVYLPQYDWSPTLIFRDLEFSTAVSSRAITWTEILVVSQYATKTFIKMLERWPLKAVWPCSVVNLFFFIHLVYYKNIPVLSCSVFPQVCICRQMRKLKFDIFCCCDGSLKHIWMKYDNSLWHNLIIWHLILLKYRYDLNSALTKDCVHYGFILPCLFTKRNMVMFFDLSSQCLWCLTNSTCTDYPVSWLLPPASVCKLSQARWGVCWSE